MITEKELVPMSLGLAPDAPTSLYRHAMLDAARRNHERIVTTLSLLCLAMVGESFPVFDALKPCFTLVLLVLLCQPDNRILACLPVSSSFRGRCNWLSYVVSPLILFLPVLVTSLLVGTFAATTALTALAAFPAGTLLLRYGSRRLAPPTLVQATLPPLFVFFIVVEYVNYVLYTRFDFRWFFLLLSPVSVAAMVYSYRRADLLGRYPFRAPAKKVPLSSERIRPERPLQAYCSFVAGSAVAGTVTIVVLFLILRLWGDVTSGLFIASGIACLISFGQTVSVIYPNLRLLRALPISRTRLALLTMGGALLSIIILFAAAWLAEVLTGGYLPGLPPKYVLMWVCGAALLPFLAIYFGHTRTIRLELSAYVVVVIVATALSRANLQHLKEMGLPWIALAACISVVTGFLLLRYALLRARLDWRYMRRAQELTKEGMV